jgi:hypothetical protein
MQSRWVVIAMRRLLQMASDVEEIVHVHRLFISRPWQDLVQAEECVDVLWWMLKRFSQVLERCSQMQERRWQMLVKCWQMLGRCSQMLGRRGWVVGAFDAKEFVDRRLPDAMPCS